MPRRMPLKGPLVRHRCKTWVLTVCAGLTLPWLAQAHAVLEDSTPAAGTPVNAGPLDLRLRFNSRIDRPRSRLTLIRPDHGQDRITILPSGAPDVVTAHVTLTPGDYILRWQVLAVDGHITRGNLPISVTAP